MELTKEHVESASSLIRQHGDLSKSVLFSSGSGPLVGTSFDGTKLGEWWPKVVARLQKAMGEYHAEAVASIQSKVSFETVRKLWSELHGGCGFTSGRDSSCFCFSGEKYEQVVRETQAGLLEDWTGTEFTTKLEIIVSEVRKCSRFLIINHAIRR